MNMLKYGTFSIATLACCLSVSLHAQHEAPLVRRGGVDKEAESATQYFADKRGVTTEDKGGLLEISGEVETKWKHAHAKTHGARQRGKGSSNLTPPKRPHAPYPTTIVDVKADILFNYRADNSWATMELEFKNYAGIKETKYKKGVNSKRNSLWGSGETHTLTLRKAYTGYNIFDEGVTRLDAEVGRRRLFDAFESRIQFNNYFDGLLLSYFGGVPDISTFTAKAAAFVIDQNVNHYGYVGEVGLMKLANSGFDFKYSLIGWGKRGVNRYNHKNSLGSRFTNSQALLAYDLSNRVGAKTRVYGAYLHNHAAKRNERTRNSKANNAFYIGATVGEVKKAQDWAVDLCYQWIQAQAIPEGDFRGIERDNPRNISFWKSRSQGYGNCKGLKVDAFYALTNNLTLNAALQRVTEQNRRIGGKHSSYRFELAAMYTF